MPVEFVNLLVADRSVSVGIAWPVWLWYVFCGVGQPCVRPTYCVLAGWAADNVTISHKPGRLSIHLAIFTPLLPPTTSNPTSAKC